VATAQELVEQGIRAYVEGRLEESRRLLDEALRLDPGSSRARSYLMLLPGGMDTEPEVRPSRPAAAPVRAPVPAPVVEAAAGADTGVEPPQDDLPEVEVQLEDSAASPASPEPRYAPSPWDDGPASSPSILIGGEGGLDLDAVAETSGLRTLVPRAARPTTPQEDVEVWMTAAKDLLALGDFSGSLEMIEKILKIDPEQAEAREYLRQNEATLVAMYESKLGPLGRVPRLAIKPEEIMWLNLDHRAGFLLSQIDGTVDYENLFALSGLPRLDTARILAGLLLDGVVTS
jgi:tetratricopeptide (TPR) repeat protein